MDVTARRRLLASLLLTALPVRAAAPAAVKRGTQISLMRFFGSCDARYGRTTDPAQASGECGIVTTLVNRFNATNADGIVVNTNVAEWGPYYDQLNARLVAKDAPTVTVMHESLLGEYVRRKLVLPLDEGLAEVGVDLSDLTDHARRGVTLNGQVHALPFDTWAWLWHFNLNLMRKAGLVNAEGLPLVPRSPQQLMEHAQRFRQATGKPYFAWAVANETAAHTRTLLTLVHQQGAKLFAEDGRAILTGSPELRTALTLMKQLYDQGHIKANVDYGSANRAWLNGDAGVLVVGTWTIDQFTAEAAKPDSPLYKGYHVLPFAQLYARASVFADGHAWALLRQGAQDPQQRMAALKLLKFLYDNNLQWARTGHLPVRRSLLAGTAFTSMPYREGLTSISRDGEGMPGNVPVQRAVEILIGEEVANHMVGGKTLEDTIASIDKRVNVTLRKARR